MLNYLPDKNSYSRTLLSNNYGFSQFYVFALALLLVAGFSMYRQNALSKKQDVLGVTQAAPAVERKGFSVLVKSNGPTWDFYEFLCSSLEQCRQSPEAGYQLPLISGGQTEGHEIIVEPNSEWSRYTHIKYYVKGGWGQGSSEFKLITPSRIAGAELGDFDGMSYVILPITSVKQGFDASAVFSN
jgi:hypothetical protein